MGSSGVLTTPLGSFGSPPDAVAMVALGLAAASFVAAVFRPRFYSWLRARVFGERSLVFVASAALALSLGYVAFYLRGGPRIIDATSYYLQARALAEGYFAFPVFEPSAAFRGRFLVTPPHDSLSQAVIFPPGYPALLSLGFFLGRPLWIGPLLAALLVVVTYHLARRISGRSDVALLAAVLSAVSAALRYHTADTMSHGLSALLLATALLVRLNPIPSHGSSALSGLCCGWLVATRPITGLLGLVLTAPTFASRRAWPYFAALVPGGALLLWHQHAATGSAFGSAQHYYYALADGPPGCFRYGFGTGIGCLFEHGDFVRARLPGGYGPTEAALTTLRRLALHLADIGNAEPFALAVGYAIFKGRRMAGIRLLGVAILGVVLFYAPFYYDGNYPGGGARFFADVLPLEHVLVAIGVCELNLARYVLPLALAGFALHTSHGHHALAEREGGRPMFEPRVLEAAGVERGLVFVGTDHGFNLAYDPAQQDAATGVVFARAGGVAEEWLLWNRLGRPATYRYGYDPYAMRAEPALVSFLPKDGDRFEAEGHWPPVGVLGGWTHPTHVAASCSSNGRGLRLRTAERTVEVSLPLPALEPGSYSATFGWIAPRGAHPNVVARIGGLHAEARRGNSQSECFTLSLPRIEISRSRQILHIAASEPGAVLDYFEFSTRP
jgi:hypothetical protein